MKKYRLIAIAALLMGLSACKKDKNNTPTGLIVGKWQENKLTLHRLPNANNSIDTTFTSGAFTTGDFYQFNSNKTVVISQSGTYIFGAKLITLDGGTILTTANHFKYSVKDSQLTFTLPDNVPQPEAGGVDPFIKCQTILQLDNTHFVLRTDFDVSFASSANSVGALIDYTIAYFTRAK